MDHSASHSEMPEVTPFWQRLPLFFRYPLHWEPLLYMAVLAMATLLGFILPLPTPLDHLLVHFGVWLAFIRYAYKTLDQTAQGRLRPDQHESHSDRERVNLPYKQFAILLVTGFVLSFAGRLGGLIFGAALIFSVLTLPASVMILSITRSFWAGLNPFAAVGMMRIIGLPYLGLCAFLFLLLASQNVLLGGLLPRLPAWALLPALNFVAMYFTLIMFNMMGYVVYQHHHLLGVPVIAPAAAGDKPGGQGGNDAEAIGRLIGAGQVDEALELAYEAQRVAPDDVAAHGRYHKLLALAGRDERLASHARRYLALLLNKGQGDEALQLFRSMRERDAAFAPEQPAALLRLAEAARRRREFPEALALVKGFDKRFPGHAEIPAVYLFAARVLCENLRQDAGARQILGALLARYPEHAVSAEARQLLAAIDKLAAAPAAR
jgi:hypothetical protein